MSKKPSESFRDYVQRWRQTASKFSLLSHEKKMSSWALCHPLTMIGLLVKLVHHFLIWYRSGNVSKTVSRYQGFSNIFPRVFKRGMRLKKKIFSNKRNEKKKQEIRRMKKRFMWFPDHLPDTSSSAHSHLSIKRTTSPTSSIPGYVSASSQLSLFTTAPIEPIQHPPSTESATTPSHPWFKQSRLKFTPLPEPLSRLYQSYGMPISLLGSNPSPWLALHLKAMTKMHAVLLML